MKAKKALRILGHDARRAVIELASELERRQGDIDRLREISNRYKAEIVQLKRERDILEDERDASLLSLEVQAAERQTFGGVSAREAGDGLVILGSVLAEDTKPKPQGQGQHLEGETTRMALLNGADDDD